MKLKKLLLFLIPFALFSCRNNFYSMDDFAKVKKTDAHFHIYTENPVSLEQAAEDNFDLMTINTFSGGCERVVEAHQWLTALKKKYPDTMEYTTTFCMNNWDEPGWTENTIAWIDRCIEDGAIAVKVWKNIGMEWRDADSSLIMIDDQRFDPIFQHLTKNNIPLVGHLGEPKNCWLPLDEMTTKNDSNYFANNPQYHMYKHPEYPSYEEQMAARDRMLEKNPNLTFIGCHLASLEWSVDEMAAFLDRFPNAAMDMAARMGQLFYQTREDHEKVRNFFIDYQDRILYGTDIIDRGGSPEAMQQRMHKTWLNDWEYLATEHTMTSNLIDGEFRGLKLPKKIIDKIYFENCKRWYNPSK